MRREQPRERHRTLLEFPPHLNISIFTTHHIASHQRGAYRSGPSMKSSLLKRRPVSPSGRYA